VTQSFALQRLPNAVQFLCVIVLTRKKADEPNVLLFGPVVGEPEAIANAIGYAKHRRRSHRAVIRVYDAAGNVIDTHEHVGDSK